jgi:hypothetical protein
LLFLSIKINALNDPCFVLASTGIPKHVSNLAGGKFFPHNVGNPFPRNGKKIHFFDA